MPHDDTSPSFDSADAGRCAGPGRSARGRKTATALALLLGAAGVTHFRAPGPYDSIVPRVLPGPARGYTYASGVAELTTAALLAVPATRRLGGWAATALFIAVFPANVQMAWDWRHTSAWKQAVVYGRLPVQGLLIAQALHVARPRR